MSVARRSLGHDLAVVHDHEAVAQLLRLVHVMGCQNERHALLLEAIERDPRPGAGPAGRARSWARRAA